MKIIAKKNDVNMAGDVVKIRVREVIANQIALRIRELLETPLNEYQVPAWVQAVELFVEIVVPCEAYSSEALYDLGVDIAKEAEKRGNRASYQAAPGGYNERLVSNSVSAADDVKAFDYSKKIESIKVWLSNYEKWSK